MKKIKKVLDQLNINMGSVVAIVLTLTLLFTSGAAMGICLVAEGVAAIGGHDAGPSGGGSGGGSSGGSSNAGANNNSNKQPITSNSQPGAKTGIVLPCATPAGNYLSAAGEGTKDISDVEEITSSAAVLVNASENIAVAGKNLDVVIHPASMTKVMTLLVACENAKDPNALLTVKQEMLARRTELDGSGELVDNTTVVNGNGLREQIQIVGKSITVEDALYLINYQSDTVACLLIAEYIAGSEQNFVNMMNNKAKELGLKNTNFVNCTGLTEADTQEHNVTTCREMAAIMACAMNNPSSKKVITSYAKYTVDVYDNGEKTEYGIPFFADWQNRPTRLDGNTKIGNLNVIGGKTGFEDISQSCFVTYAVDTKSGKNYICVTVGKLISEDKEVVNKTSTADTRKIYKDYAK